MKSVRYLQALRLDPPLAKRFGEPHDLLLNPRNNHLSGSVDGADGHVLLVPGERHAHILDASFSKCPVSYGHFPGSTLMKVRFSNGPEETEMTRVDFSRALLVDVNLSRANLYAASFRGACLVRVNLRGSNLVGADFTGAVMLDVDLSGADSDRAIFGPAPQDGETS